MQVWCLNTQRLVMPHVVFSVQEVTSAAGQLEYASPELLRARGVDKEKLVGELRACVDCSTCPLSVTNLPLRLRSLWHSEIPCTNGGDC